MDNFLTDRDNIRSDTALTKHTKKSFKAWYKEKSKGASLLVQFYLWLLYGFIWIPLYYWIDNSPPRKKNYRIFVTVVAVVGILFIMAMDYREEKLYRKAEELYRQKKWQECIISLNSILKFNKKRIKAYELRGYCYYHQKKYRQALSDWQRVIKDSPKVIPEIKEVELLLRKK